LTTSLAPVHDNLNDFSFPVGGLSVAILAFSELCPTQLPRVRLSEAFLCGSADSSTPAHFSDSVDLPIDKQELPTTVTQ
jgi:hypothetical protein